MEEEVISPQTPFRDDVPQMEADVNPVKISVIGYKPTVLDRLSTLKRLAYKYRIRICISVSVFVTIVLFISILSWGVHNKGELDTCRIEIGVCNAMAQYNPHPVSLDYTAQDTHNPDVTTTAYNTHSSERPYVCGELSDNWISAKNGTERTITRLKTGCNIAYQDFITFHENLMNKAMAIIENRNYIKKLFLHPLCLTRNACQDTTDADLYKERMSSRVVTPLDTFISAYNNLVQNLKIACRYPNGDKDCIYYPQPTP